MNVYERLATQVGELFRCSTTARGDTRIRTPFRYPDGGIVDLFLVEQSNETVITDFGEALGGRSLEQDVCQTHGVELVRGQIVARVPSPEHLAETLIRASQAAVRLADLRRITPPGTR